MSQLFSAIVESQDIPTASFPTNVCILLVYFIFLDFVLIILGRKKMFYPSLVLSGMFTITCAVSFLFSNSYGYDIRVNTVVVIILMSLAFVSGDVLFRFFYRSCIKKQPEAPKTITVPSRFVFHWWLFIIVLALLAGVTYLQYKTEMSLVTEYLKAEPESFYDFLHTARIMATNNILSLPTYLNQLMAIIKCVSYVLIFGFIFNITFYRFNLSDLLFLVPLPIYFVSMVLTTGRTDMIFFFGVMIFSIFFCIQKRSRYDSVGNVLIALSCLILGFAFCLIFFATGKLKYGGGSSLDTVYNYIGSPITNLDVYLNGVSSETTIFGEHTLYSLYNLLAKFGLNVPSLPNASLPGVTYPNFSSNIYTMFLRWIMDFGLAGCFLLSFFWGTVYSLFFLKAEDNQGISFFLLVLAYLMYPLMLSSIEDGFIATYSFSLLYNVIYMYIVWRVFAPKNRYSVYYFEPINTLL